jgi:hypothetical protein
MRLATLETNYLSGKKALPSSVFFKYRDLMQSIHLVIEASEQTLEYKMAEHIWRENVVFWFHGRSKKRG